MAKAEIAPPRWPEKSISINFPMRPSSMLQEERPLESQISRLIPTLSSRGLVFHDRLNTRIGVTGPPRHPSSTARAKIAPPRRPKRQILNLGLLCCWRGALISVHISASTSPLCARFVYMYENTCLIRYMRNSIGFLKIKETGFVGSTHHSRAIWRGYEDFDSFQRSNMPSLLCRINSVFDILPS